MRKRLLLTFVSVATAVAAFSQTQKVVTVPYSSDLGIPESSSTSAAGSVGNIDPAWTAVDADKGKSVSSEGVVTVYTNEWKYARNTNITGVGATGGVMLNVLAYYNTDDWLISPPIILEAGKTYNISWYSYSTSYSMSYKTMIAPNVSEEDFLKMQEENENLTYPEVLDARLDEGETIGEVTTEKNTIKQSIYSFQPEATGEYRLGFWFNSVKVGGGNLFLTKFEIVEGSESIVIPGVITDLTATPVGTELKVDLSWKLPEKDEAGKPLNVEDISAVKIWRGEELVKTTEGAATSYTDDVPSSGFYTYTVAAVGTREGASAVVETPFVGEMKPYTIPYAADFSDAKMTEAFWTTIDNNEDGIGWKFDGSSFKFENYSSAITEDDWLISPELSFEKAGTYRLTWKGSCYNGKLLFALGDANTVAAMTSDDAVEIGQVELTGYSTVEKKMDFTVAEAGNYYIGIRCYNSPSAASPYTINAFSVSEITEDDIYQTITIPAEGSMAFSSKDALDFTGVAGIKAYYATVEDDILTINEVAQVPASAGVILKGEAGEYKIPYITTASALEGNVIVGAINGQNLSAGDFIYRDGDKGMGFYRTEEAATLPAGSGYLRSSIGNVNFISADGGPVIKTTQTITVGEDGSMTYSLDRGLDFSSAEGITAYIIDKVEEGTYSCKEIEKVPASTGILIKAEAGEYEVAYCDDAETVSGNQLKSAITGVPVTAGAFVYRNGTEGMGFYKLTEGITMPDNTAYLPSYASMSAFIKEKANTSSILEIITEEIIPDAVYDLNGRKVAYPRHGIYVINGKPVMIK